MNAVQSFIEECLPSCNVDTALAAIEGGQAGMMVFMSELHARTQRDQRAMLKALSEMKAGMDMMKGQMKAMHDSMESSFDQSQQA
ncbi:MAG: hypothetical protein ACOVQL_04205, partial [Limnohabitans sp.]